MKVAARIALAIVILLAGFLLLPRPLSRVVAPDAAAGLKVGPTDLLEDVKDKLSPSPTPTETKTPKPPKPPGGGGGGGDPTGGGGGGDPTGGGGNGPTGGGGGNNTGGDKGSGKGVDKGSEKGDDATDDGATGGTGPGGYSGNYSFSGEFNTDKLQIVAAQLRARGVPEDEILKTVYAPFMTGGPAAWTDTWGAPRYGPGPIVRTHEGQDVFCKYGDPILASESGTIEFDDGGLGGIIARLYRSDGSYWYYAHLAGQNTKEFKSGDRVQPGDVIGYCGNSGNAISTPPHTHFGWYQADGSTTKDPMATLVKWLRTAERNAGAAFEKETGKSIADLAESQSRRLFGDGFAPDITELKVSADSLLAASSSPGAGAFGLAEAALQAALAGQSELAYDPRAFAAEGAGHTEDSKLAELLQGEASLAHSSDASD